MLHSVTLGGTGKEDGDRHPKIGDGVLIGAGAKVLGNIRVGACSRIAAGSVVLQDVPPCTTVAGVPARVVGQAGCDQPALSMNRISSLATDLDKGRDRRCKGWRCTDALGRKEHGSAHHPFHAPDHSVAADLAWQRAASSEACVFCQSYL